MSVKAIPLLPLLASLWGAAIADPVLFEGKGWHGDDGQFSTFELSVGTPAQQIKVLPVPFRSALVVVGSEGCLKDSAMHDCIKQRGNVFESKSSGTWHAVSSDQWDPMEQRIMPPRIPHNGSVRQEPLLQHPVTPGTFNYLGIDTVSATSLGKQWSIPDQGIMSITNMYPVVGRLGLSTNVDGVARNPTSLFDHVRGINNMKSVSWSYTAGNKAKKIPGSLVFGGIDKSRLVKGSKLMALQLQPHSSFQIQMNSISVFDPTRANPSGYESILLGMETVGLDFSSSDLEFPHNVCEHLKSKFGMHWNESLGRYTVNDTRHDELIASNASLSLNLIDSNGRHVPYFIPYESLVINASAPTYDQPTRYIAIRRSGGERYNLGRVFFQEAVITAHYDNPRGPFIYLHQAQYNAGAAPQIKEINSARGLKLRFSKHGDKLGIILPVIFCVLALIAITAYLVWARRVGWIPFRNTQKKEEPEAPRVENREVWAGDRKEAPPELLNRQSNNGSVYYEAQTEINHDDALEGSSHPPPRYSVAVAEPPHPDVAGRGDTKTSS